MVTNPAGKHPEVNLQQATQAAYHCQGTCYGAFTMYFMKEKF